VMWIQWPTIPVWWQKKRYCSDMPSVVAAIAETSHEIQIPSIVKNISVTTLVAEIGVPREIHRPVASHWQTLSHNVLSSTPRSIDRPLNGTSVSL
jgi:hypothetical protein